MRTAEEARFIADAKEAIHFRKERLRRLKVIEEGGRGDFWQSLKREVELSVQSAEIMRDGALLDDDAKDAAMQYAKAKARALSILAYKGIIHVVENAESAMRKVNEEIARYSRQITEIEQGKTKLQGKEVV